MDGRPTWIDYGEAVDYVVPNVLGPSLQSDKNETVPHTLGYMRSEANVCWLPWLFALRFWF